VTCRRQIQRCMTAHPANALGVYRHDGQCGLKCKDGRPASASSSSQARICSFDYDIVRRYTLRARGRTILHTNFLAIFPGQEMRSDLVHVHYCAWLYCSCRPYRAGYYQMRSEGSERHRKFQVYLYVEGNYLTATNGFIRCLLRLVHEQTPYRLWLPKYSL
jgi:hypothetical protein